jgi:glycosyltransferase involved in cell wall biosynthesis
VIHEAKLWGIPVVATNTGGIPEILTAGFDASLSLDAITPESIAAGIRKALMNSMDARKRLNVAKSHSSFLQDSIGKHFDFYSSL